MTTNDDASGERTPWGVWTFDVDGMSKTETPRWWGWKDDWAAARRGATSNLVVTGVVSDGLSLADDDGGDEDHGEDRSYESGYRQGYRDGWRDRSDD